MEKPVALVTNALQFAGPPAVTALLSAGFRVFAHDIAFVEVDVRSRFLEANPGATPLSNQEPADIIEATWLVANRLNVLVSNDAYPAVQSSIAAASSHDLNATLNRLIVFPFELARAAIPKLVASEYARVVMITSNRNRLPLLGGAIPDIARAGLNALVKSLSFELAPHGIPVNAIAPNFLYSETYYPRARYIDDDRGRRYIAETVPTRRLGTPEEIGELIRYLATMRGTFLTGSIIDFSGGWPMGVPRPF